jgi:hypothetical protein
MPINYKSYSGKYQLERSLAQCSETYLGLYLFHSGIKPWADLALLKKCAIKCHWRIHQKNSNQRMLKLSLAMKRA